MSQGMILFCLDCKEYVYIGTSNSETVEEPKIVGEFLWAHDGHSLRTFNESTMTYQYNVYEVDGAEYMGKKKGD